MRKKKHLSSINLNNFSFHKNSIKAKLKEVFYFLISANEQGQSGPGLETVAHNSHLSLITHNPLEGQFPVEIHGEFTKF